MDQNFISVVEFIEGISNSILSYALVLAAVGTITMALLELIKGVFQLRQLFHDRMLNWWIGRIPDTDKDKVLDELLTFAGGGEADKNILYDQPTSKMMGQIQAAANIALDFPTTYPELYKFLTSVSERKTKNIQHKSVLSDQQAWLEFSQQLSAEMKEPPGESVARQASQARSRLGNFVARRLDAFQTRQEFYWARLNQLVAIVMGCLLLLYVLIQANKDIGSFNIILLSVAGGLVAPFAKDVVSALSGLRVRRQ